MTDSDALQSFLQRYDQLMKEKSQRPGRDTFTTEFQQIKRDSEKLSVDGQTVATAGAKECNRKKNRYKDILPFDHTRVILKRNGSEEGSDYINASYIKSPDGKKGYIASQGPMPSTVDDFWWMIWQHKIKVVVMACKEIELGKHRCQRYWPANGEELRFGPVAVTLVREELIANCLTKRTLKAVFGNEEHRLWQLHYTAWPDHGVPKTTQNLIHIIELVREIHPWDSPPVLLHCSAGCGRTGVMVAVDYGRRIIRKSPSSFNVIDIVMTLRKQRPAMVQSKEQYEYLHEVFRDLILEQMKKKGDFSSSYVNLEFPRKDEDIHLYENVDTACRLGETQARTEPTVDAKSFFLRERLEEPRRPMITTNVMNPQKAVIKTELRNKPVPLPNKKPGLTNQGSTSPKSVLPVPLSPTPVIPETKPFSNSEHVPQNYINVEVGPPKVPAKPVHAESKQKLHVTNSNENSDKRNDFSHSALSLPEKPASQPKLPLKPKPCKENASPIKSINAPHFDYVDGKKPPLPLKQKDLADFDSFAPSDKTKKGSDSGNEAILSLGNEPLFGTTKSRTLGKEDENSRRLRLDLWDTFSPDYDTSSENKTKRSHSDFNLSESTRIPSQFTDRSDKGNISLSKVKQEIPKQKQLNSATVNDVVRHSEGPAMKNMSAKDIFTPFEPASTVRVSPIPPEMARDKRVEVKQTESETHIPFTEKKQQFQISDGLVGRTNASIMRKGVRNDGLVNRTNYLVSIEKSVSTQRSDHHNPPLNATKRPMLPKTESADSIKPVGSSNISLTRMARFLSDNSELERKGNNSKNPLDNGRDLVDAGDANYAMIEVKSRDKTDHLLYESIWAAPTPKPTRPKIKEDLPPELPPRTLDSLILVGKTAIEEERNPDNEIAENGDTTPKETESTASGDQGSFPWMSAGVDRLKKITNLKGAFAVALKNPSRQTSSGANSQFYSEGVSAEASVRDHDMSFGRRLPHRPKGPRPMPSKWHF
ncbi:uncharacterized protein LOC135692673 [Rhopilema esculentum]|uniref:uncharacterized protein LOC135692673 n=1 Tax=Rhopilema esculentum TaxID=499914 RepID=UPI0031CE283B